MVCLKKQVYYRWVCMEYKEYRDEINHIFSHYAKRGFVDYYNCRGLWSDMTSLLAEATGDLGRQMQYKELFDLANKAFLKWAKTSKDDSDGETQDFVEYVVEAWDVVYDSCDEKINHSKMLEWFMKNLDGSVIDYMEDELYRYMMGHFKEEQLQKKKMDFLQEKIKLHEASGDKFQLDYAMPRCQEHVLTLMSELHYPIEEIRTYSQNIKRYSVKETLAKIEMSYGNMDEAIALYQELADREDQRWGRNEYREKLMQIYKELGDSEKYFDSLKQAMFRAVGDMKLWEEYKSNFKTEDWAEARAVIFSSIGKRDFRANTWYTEEDRYDLIMNNVEAYEGTDQLKEYEKKLKKLYPERCRTVLICKADRTAMEATKRADYRRLAGLLNWIQKYPEGDAIVENLAQKYRDAYPRRKAMLEELERF